MIHLRLHHIDLPHPGGRRARLAWKMAALVLVVLLLARAIGTQPEQTSQLIAFPNLAPVQEFSLPYAAFRSTLRMGMALLASLAFSLVVAPLAAKSRTAAIVLVPTLDVLQSIPVLAFVGFSAGVANLLLPGTRLGLELACVLTIATSQAWNMAFSLYHSLRTVPIELDDAARLFGMTGWQRFWRLEIPFAVPSLVWNAMMSLAGGWFYVVASEAIVSRQSTEDLPGIGTALSHAMQAHDNVALVHTLLAMMVTIILGDQLILRPLISWCGHFRNETVTTLLDETPWMVDLLRRAKFGRSWMKWLSLLIRRFGWLRLGPPAEHHHHRHWGESNHHRDHIFLAILIVVGVAGMVNLLYGMLERIPAWEILTAFAFGLETFLRVLVTVAIALAIWVPIGVWMAAHPKLFPIARPVVQVLASFPANLLFPTVAALAMTYGVTPDIAAIPLMFLGAQWFVLYNVFAGMQNYPGDLREAADIFRVDGWTRLHRVILPGLLPSIITGAVAASGAAWNSAIVAEYAQWGSGVMVSEGIGAYIAEATEHGDGARLLLGVFVMSRFVMAMNALVWQRLFRYAHRRAT